MTAKRLSAIEKRIDSIKSELSEVGEMRPGSLTRQYRETARGGSGYWQLSYTHRMKSRTDYIRPGLVSQTKAQIRTFKRFRKLVTEWTDLSIEHAKLKAKLSCPR